MQQTLILVIQAEGMFDILSSRFLLYSLLDMRENYYELGNY